MSRVIAIVAYAATVERLGPVTVVPNGAEIPIPDTNQIDGMFITDSQLNQFILVLNNGFDNDVYRILPDPVRSSSAGAARYKLSNVQVLNVGQIGDYVHVQNGTVYGNTYWRIRGLFQTYNRTPSNTDLPMSSFVSTRHQYGLYNSLLDSQPVDAIECSALYNNVVCAVINLNDVTLDKAQRIAAGSYVYPSSAVPVADSSENISTYRVLCFYNNIETPQPQGPLLSSLLVDVGVYKPTVYQGPGGSLFRLLQLQQDVQRNPSVLFHIRADTRTFDVWTPVEVITFEQSSSNNTLSNSLRIASSLSSTLPPQQPSSITGHSYRHTGPLVRTPGGGPIMQPGPGVLLSASVSHALLPDFQQQSLMTSSSTCIEYMGGLASEKYAPLWEQLNTGWQFEPDSENENLLFATISLDKKSFRKRVCLDIPQCGDVVLIPVVGVDKSYQGIYRVDGKTTIDDNRTSKQEKKPYKRITLSLFWLEPYTSDLIVVNTPTTRNVPAEEGPSSTSYALSPQQIWKQTQTSLYFTQINQQSTILVDPSVVLYVNVAATLNDLHRLTFLPNTYNYIIDQNIMVMSIVFDGNVSLQSGISLVLIKEPTAPLQGVFLYQQIGTQHYLLLTTLLEPTSNITQIHVLHGNEFGGTYWSPNDILSYQIMLTN